MTQDASPESSSSLSNLESAVQDTNPFTFRVAEAVFDAPMTPSVRVDSPVERTLDETISLTPTFLEHEAIVGIPFTGSYYKMDKSFKNMDTKTQDQVIKIDSYIREKMEKGHLTDSAETAISLIKELEKKVKLDENTDPFYRLDKMTNYLDHLGEYAKHESIKKKALAEAQVNEINDTKKKYLNKVKQEREKSELEKQEIVDKLKTQQARVKQQSEHKLNLERQKSAKAHKELLNAANRALEESSQEKYTIIEAKDALLNQSRQEIEEMSDRADQIAREKEMITEQKEKLAKENKSLMERLKHQSSKHKNILSLLGLNES